MWRTSSSFFRHCWLRIVAFGDGRESLCLCPIPRPARLARPQSNCDARVYLFQAGYRLQVQLRSPASRGGNCGSRDADCSFCSEAMPGSGDRRDRFRFF